MLKNIKIDSSAQEVNAWLIADGYINTCNSIPAGNPTSLTINTCNNKLTVNGPIATEKLYLYRTAGSDGDGVSQGNPAEVMNLRADAYLWLYNYANCLYASPDCNNVAQTVYSTELPPRF